MQSLIVVTAKYALYLSLAITAVVWLRLPRQQKWEFVVWVVLGGAIAVALVKLGGALYYGPAAVRHSARRPALSSRAGQWLSLRSHSRQHVSGRVRPLLLHEVGRRPDRRARAFADRHPRSHRARDHGSSDHAPRRPLAYGASLGRRRGHARQRRRLGRPSQQSWRQLCFSCRRERRGILRSVALLPQRRHVHAAHGRITRDSVVDQKSLHTATSPTGCRRAARHSS
jgi:hypothetical protein